MRWRWRANVVPDDPDLYHGMHVGLQLVGRRLQEEKMVGLAAYVEEVLAR